MTAPSPDDRRRSLEGLAGTWLGQRAGAAGASPAPALVDVAVLRPGRPGLLDVVVDDGGHLAHLVVGLRRPGDESPVLHSGDDPVLGLLDDPDGLAVAVDALRDADLAPMVLAAVYDACPADCTVTAVSDDENATVLTYGDRCTLSVFPRLRHGPHPAVEVLVGLDEVGFNHLAAPLARWNRDGRDLGIVQEHLVGTAGGWSLALTSLRDLYATDVAPDKAGGDFAPEASALGTMAGRLHLALDRAFGRRSAAVDDWLDEVEAVVRGVDPERLTEAPVVEALAAVRAASLRAPALRTHGDLNLGRTARTDHGWVIADFLPGGIPPGAESPVFRSPLADVADMLWSFHHVATVAATERDPTGRVGLADRARAWESRNRRAFLAGYLAVPGIGGLVPSDRDLVRNLAAVFELERAARAAAL